MIYHGACHCGLIAFEVEGELSSAAECNCSICSKTAFLHWKVEPSRLRMLSPWNKLATYIWGTGTARHYFCPVCGVAPLRNPRSDPGKISVNVRCLDGVDIFTLTIFHIDGRAFTTN